MPPRLIIIHDNPLWIQRLTRTCQNKGILVEDWKISSKIPDRIIHLMGDGEPPQAVYLNRISSSSHYREGRFAIEYVKQILHWLNRYGRTVINGLTALDVEISKFYQYQILLAYGLNHPITYLATSREQISKLVTDTFHSDCIVKDNRSGSGLSVIRIKTPEDMQTLTASSHATTGPVDGLQLVQQYIKPKNNVVVRLEFVGYQFLYAVQINEVGNNFHLCPADKCNLEGNKFEIIANFLDDPEHQNLVETLTALCRAREIMVCGIEFLRDESGKIYVYDINTNTNYNSSAERRADRDNDGNIRLADYVIELQKV